MASPSHVPHIPTDAVVGEWYAIQAGFFLGGLQVVDEPSRVYRDALDFRPALQNHL
jgi:hypothetical protein